jgi:hypothetical protein
LRLPGKPAPNLSGLGRYYGRIRRTIVVVEPPTRFAWTWGIQGLPATDPRRTYVEFTRTPKA